MRIYLSLPVLAFATLLGFSAGGAQAGRFFGSSNNGADYTYQNPYPSQNGFGFGPGSNCSNCQARHQYRHRLFHRDQGLVNNGMPANALPGYGMQPAYGMPYEQMQTPIVQSPMLTPPVHMTSMAPAAVPVVPAVQSPSCSRCGQAAQVQAAQVQAAQVQATPAVQSRIVPVPAPMPTGPTTAEPPTAEPTGNPPF